MNQYSTVRFQFEKDHLNRYAMLMLELAQRVLATQSANMQAIAEQELAEQDRSQQLQRGISLVVMAPLLKQAIGTLQKDDAIETSLAYGQYVATLCDKLAELGAYGKTQDRLPRFNDGFGHTRSIYWPLLIQMVARIIHLTLCDAQHKKQCLAKLHEAIDCSVGNTSMPRNQTAMTAWLALSQCATTPEDAAMPAEAVQQFSQIVDASGPSGELHLFDESEQLLDTWWYNELVGLHALLNAAVLGVESVRFERVAAMAMHHMGNIQPDHVTSQPWGCAAFVCVEQARTFADQQLHDAATELHAHPQLPAWVHAMLLVDGAMTLVQQKNSENDTHVE